VLCKIPKQISRVSHWCCASSAYCSDQYEVVGQGQLASRRQSRPYLDDDCEDTGDQENVGCYNDDRSMIVRCEFLKWLVGGPIVRHGRRMSRRAALLSLRRNLNLVPGYC
jgi:hypothetical protein